MNKKVYNLRLLEDRLLLGHEMANPTEDVLLGYHDAMFKQGYGGYVSDKDKVFFHFFGREMYDQLSESAFRYSCFEAEYLKMERHTLQFIELNRTNRENMWNQCIEMLPYAVYDKEMLHLDHIPTDEEMIKKISKKYRSKESQKDFMKSHHDQKD